MTSLVKCNFFILCFLSCMAGAKGQTFVTSKDSTDNSIDFRGNFNGVTIHLQNVKKTPEYREGKEAWQNFLRKNMNVKLFLDNHIQPGNYRALIRFIVDTAGNIKEVSAETNCGYQVEAEIIRCIRKSLPWIPAETASGKKVQFTLRQFVNLAVKPNDIVITFK